MGPIYIQMSCFLTFRAIPPWCPTVLSTNLLTNTNTSKYKQMHTFRGSHVHMLCTHSGPPRQEHTYHTSHLAGLHCSSALSIGKQWLCWCTPVWAIYLTLQNSQPLHSKDTARLMLEYYVYIWAHICQLQATFITVFVKNNSRMISDHQCIPNRIECNTHTHTHTRINKVRIRCWFLRC